MNDNTIKNLIKQNYELKKENINLKEENKQLKKEIKNLNFALSSANNRIRQLDVQIKRSKEDEQKRIEEIVLRTVNKVVEDLNKEHQKEINKLQGEISRLKVRLNIDSTNSGTPTSKETIGKHTIQNNREKSEKSKGAQLNHKQAKLDYFKEEEITNVVEHTLECCPECGGQLVETNVVRSDILDINITITKTKNNIHNYKCPCCKKNVTANATLPRGVTYGDNINSIGLSMMNEANTPLNKITSFFNGITNGEVNLCEGYLIKLQKRNADRLTEFNHNLKEKIISLSNVYWDDTITKFGIGKPDEGYDEKDVEYFKNREKEDSKTVTRNGIIRFYGDDKWALLIGHRHKNLDGINDDGILDNLPANCTVMHDHVLLNYNDKYSFKNAECNEHTTRYLKKNMDMFTNHEWAKEMRDLLLSVNKEKKTLIESGNDSFSDDKLQEIFNSYDEIIKKGYLENNKVDLTYILNKTDELNLLERLERFKENHLLFAKDFSVEFTNNTSERGLRQIKRKLAVSFMFNNAVRMKDYASILSYLETCYRHGISRYEAAKRLVSGNPYSIKELSEIVGIEK